MIVSADNVELKDDSALAQVLNKHKPGDEIGLVVLRNGNRQNVTVTLGQTE